MERRVIFFDAADTLFRVRGSVGGVYRELGEPYGVSAPADVIDGAFARAFGSAPPLAFPGASSLELIRNKEREWWRRIVHAVFSEVGMIRSFDLYFEEIYGAFRGLRGWELYPETLDILRRLRRDGIRMGIISNFDSRLIEVLEALNINEFFDTLTISSREGCAKPDPKIFLAALKKHECAPDRAVHVGDSLTRDIGGAIAAGMRAVWLDRGGQSVRVDGARSIPSLETLPELIRSGLFDELRRD